MLAKAWDAANWIALVGIVIAPLAALAGAWLNGYLARQARSEEHLEAQRADAAAALGPMLSLLLDAEPTLVMGGELREYADAETAVKGLYKRWLKAREPLLVVSLAQPSREVREMGILLQAEAEMLLRNIGDGDMDGARETHARALALASDLTQRLFPVPTSVGARSPSEGTDASWAAGGIPAGRASAAPPDDGSHKSGG